MVIRCPLPRLVSVDNEYLVHQLPGLLNGLPVDLQPRRGHRGGEGPMDPGQQVVGEVARPPRGHHPPSFPSFSSSSTFSLFALNPHPASSPHSEKLWRAVLKLERVSPDDGGSFEVRWLLPQPLQRLVELPRRYSAASHSSHSTSSSSSPVHLFLSYFLIDTICVVDTRNASISYISTVPAPH